MTKWIARCVDPESGAEVMHVDCATEERAREAFEQGDFTIRIVRPNGTAYTLYTPPRK